MLVSNLFYIFFAQLLSFILELLRSTLAV